VFGPVGIGLSIAAAQDAPVNEAPYAQQYESHLSVRADHTTTNVFTQRFKILTQSAIASVSQQKLTFVEGMQTLIPSRLTRRKPTGDEYPSPRRIF